MLYMFEVQIPVDACTLLGLKRRSLLFVIEIYKRLRVVTASFFIPDRRLKNEPP